MPAYLVSIRESTRDETKLKPYSKAAAASIAGHAITPRIVYGDHIDLEGAPAEGIAMLEFPTFDEALAWYHSPAYQAARNVRAEAGTYSVYIVEGQ